MLPFAPDLAVDRRQLHLAARRCSAPSRLPALAGGDDPGDGQAAVRARPRPGRQGRSRALAPRSAARPSSSSSRRRAELGLGARGRRSGRRARAEGQPRGLHPARPREPGVADPEAAIARGGRVSAPRTRRRLHPRDARRHRGGDRARPSRRPQAAGCELLMDREEVEKRGGAVEGVSVVDDLARRAGPLPRPRRRRHDPARACASFAGTDVPVFGINYGTVGFLAAAEADELETGLERAFAGEFEVVSLPGPRAGRRATGARSRSTTSRSPAAPTSGSPSSATRVGGREVGRVRCDGLVAATPAGSTGYNLANNGPILAWGVEGYVVSFIAPHTLTARALVVAPGDVLHVINVGELDAVDIGVDGVAGRPARPRRGGRVGFRDGMALLAQLEGENFYRRRVGMPRRSFGPALAPLSSAARIALDRSPCGSAAPLGVAVTCGHPRLMLRELRIENLLLIERAELRFGDGLNVITGETGAGKTVLAHSLDLLLGGKPRSGIVRPGAEEAWVEGAFEVPDGAARRPRARRARRADAARARRSSLARRVSAAGPLGGVHRRPLGHGGRPARARHPPARLLRPARAPQADPRRGPGRDPRRLRRRRASRAARPLPRRPRRASSRCSASATSSSSARAPGSATSTCSASSSPRSRRPPPTPGEHAGLDGRARPAAPRRARCARAPARRSARGRRRRGGRRAPPRRWPRPRARWPAPASDDPAPRRARRAGGRARRRGLASSPHELRAYLEGIEADPGAARGDRGRLDRDRPAAAQARRHDRGGARARRRTAATSSSGSSSAARAARGARRRDRQGARPSAPSSERS